MRRECPRQVDPLAGSGGGCMSRKAYARRRSVTLRRCAAT